jgi:hypothetical protein
LKYTVQTILVEKRVNPTNWLSSQPLRLPTRGSLSDSQRLEISKRDVLFESLQTVEFIK